MSSWCPTAHTQLILIMKRFEWGRRVVGRPRRAKSDCPTTGVRRAALTLVRLE
jgi:hypothetical protein